MNNQYEEYIANQKPKNKYFINESFSQYLKLLIAVILFLMLSNILKNEYDLEIYGLLINSITLKGIIAHIQVMISVFLVLNTIRKGYLIATLLNLFGIIMVFFAILKNSDLNALPGITSYTISIIIITLLYQYRQHIFSQLNLLLEQREKLEHLAYYDSLTEIINRKRFIDILNHLISENSKNENRFSLVFIDLNNFKKINDTLGHFVGDVVLKIVVDRFKSYIHDDDILGRLGGDEFALIINRDLSKKELLKYVEGMSDLFLKNFIYENKEITIGGSFGISIYPDDANVSSELLKCADIAMYKAKIKSGKSVELFSKDLQEGYIENIKMENGLQEAIKKDELYLLFQPQYNSQSKMLRGFEVLLRWDSRELGSVSPARFIPVAESTGLINDIGKWVFINALKEINDIYNKYNIDLILSINISVSQLIEPGFVNMVKSILEDTGFDSSRLEFEVTESIFISYPEYVNEVLRDLKKMGISIALDDFGTGYASLSYLQNITLDTLKIDKLFIDSINNYNGKKSIIGPIIEMAHQLGIEVIAEGVENRDQLNYLRDQNCDYIQGYLLGRPVKEEQLKNVVVEGARVSI